ncbi:transposable element Tc1 transposase [Trichonephila clavipes]|nr:transposable element Tc1 transposase [Trichonephila clavipes]
MAIRNLWQQWTDKHRTTRRTSSGRGKETSVRDDRHLLRMSVNDRTTSSRIPLKGNHRRLRLQWVHERRAWQADWYQVVFSDESRFNLCDQDGRNRVRRLTMPSRVCNLNVNRYVREVLQPEVVPFLQGILGAIFQEDNARPHVANTVRDFCSARHMKLLPWPSYPPDMSPIEHVWDLVGRRRARDACTVASKEELLLRIQAICNMEFSSTNRYLKSV